MEALTSELLGFAYWCIGFLVRSTMALYVYLTTTWTHPDSMFFWPWFLVFLFWAGLAYRFNYHEHGLRNFFRFCFPREIYLHRSTATDVELLLLNQFLYLPGRLLKGFAAPALAAWVLGLQPGDPIRAFPLDPFTSLVYWGIWLAAAELAYYGAHRAFHRVPVLWEFHKVHHSAEVLTPFTLLREHPVFQMGNALTVAVIRGTLLVAMVVLSGGEFHAVHLFAFNLSDLVFRAAGQHLRHSHIWFAWGPRLSHVFLSPAQHQVHHSCDPRHLNKNFGEMFAIWDWMFGTLYVTGRQIEALRIGLGIENHGLVNAAAAYWVPVRNVGRMAVASFRTHTVARSRAG